MDPYDDRFAPVPFGLYNTGVICYFNAFLQTLAGCTAFTKAALSNEPYLRRTATGTAVFKFISAFANRAGALHQPAVDIASLSATVLRALVEDLAHRRPHVRFGGGQESASEALVHLLDMMEPACEENDQPAEKPITNLFLHRFRCDLLCLRCKKVVSQTTDHAVNFNLFHLDEMRAYPKSVADFSKAVRVHVSATEDYVCSACPCAGCGSAVVDGKCSACRRAQTKSTAYRVYNLSVIPEIIFCMFNLYNIRAARYFPERLEFPAIDGGALEFRIVGQVEHSGSLSGGHYWARGLRSGGTVCLLNDAGVSASAFGLSASTYIVAYHYVGHKTATATATAQSTATAHSTATAQSSRALKKKVHWNTAADNIA